MAEITSQAVAEELDEGDRLVMAGKDGGTPAPV
jgi:hypothetical protein